MVDGCTVFFIANITCMKSLEKFSFAKTGLENSVAVVNLCNIGLNLYKNGDYDGAIDKIEMALAFHLKTSGSEHPEVADLWNNLGGMAKPTTTRQLISINKH